MRMAELFSPLAKPMLIPPRNWHPLQDGGYYLNDLTRCHNLIRRTDDGLIQGEIPYEFINKIQQGFLQAKSFYSKGSERVRR